MKILSEQLQGEYVHHTHDWTEVMEVVSCLRLYGYCSFQIGFVPKPGQHLTRKWWEVIANY